MIKTTKEQQTEILASIGLALSYVQLAERLIRGTLLMVIQSGEALDWERWQSQTEFLGRKTLGQLVNVLKKRADLNEHFDELLERFIKERNTLAHDLDRIEGYSLQTIDGIEKGHSFISGLVEDTTNVIKIFSSLHLDWSKQTGISTPFDGKVREFIGEDFEGIADYLFFSKEKADPL